MTTNDDFDRRLSTWLSGHEWEREPERLIGEVLARTAQTRRRPAWQIPERWLSMSAITTRFAPTAPVPWRTIGLVAILILGLVAGALLWAGAQLNPALPYGLAANGSLIYSVDGDIVRRASPEAPATAIIATGDTDTDPILALDGTRFAFLRHLDGDRAELWLANIDGTNPKPLQSPFDLFNSIDWSPVGDVLAITSDADPTAIVLVRADGGAFTRLETGVIVEGPSFRPVEGSQISFRGRDGSGELGIYLMNRDGSGLLRLDLDSGFQEDPFYAENRAFYFNDPTWSANGGQLAFHTLEPDLESEAGPGFRIHLADIGTTGSVESEQTLEFNAASDDEFAATWLPGGDGIAFRQLEGSTHTVWLAPVGSTIGPARYLGLVGPDFVGVQMSPDGELAIALVPPSQGATPLSSLVDLASGTARGVDLGSDVVWQRLAP